MGTRRTDAELRAMHAEKQAALTERMAAKADPRIKAARQLHDSLTELAESCADELAGMGPPDACDDLSTACETLNSLGDFLVRQWADKEARGEA